MKFFTVLVCTLLFAVKANAADVNASTCNICNENQKTQRAILARQENGLSHQYVLDLVSGTLTKYKVYLESSCRPTKPSTKDLTTHTAERCGRDWIADAEVVEPELLESGQALSTIFLYYGTTQAKVEVNVADLLLGNPTLAGMDAFDYTNTSSYRNSLNESLIAAIRDQALGNLNPTIGDAIANLLKPLDRLFADGKIFILDVTYKFADGSEVTIEVKGEHSFTVTEAPQDANNNDVAADAASAAGQTYLFNRVPTDYGDWVNYMRGLGVRVTNGSGGGRMSCSSDIVDGVTVVRCIAI